MNLELFRFVKHSATTSSSASRLGSDNMDVANSEDPAMLRSEDPAVPPSKMRCFNSKWSEGHMWLKHDRDNDMMFSKWCRRFDAKEHRNQFMNMRFDEAREHEEAGEQEETGTVKTTQRLGGSPTCTC